MWTLLKLFKCASTPMLHQAPRRRPPPPGASRCTLRTAAAVLNVRVQDVRARRLALQMGPALQQSVPLIAGAAAVTWSCSPSPRPVA